MPELLIHAARLVDAQTDGAGWLQTDGARIVARGEGEPPRPPDLRLDLVLPAFVDIHTHGGCGIDFGGVGVNPEPAIGHHHRNGSTTIEATIATGTPEAMKTRIRELASYVATGDLVGIHLEGPWLAPARKGAHDLSLLRTPEPAEVMDLIEAGAGAVRMITIAPELPGAIESIRAMVAAGVVAALGHTAADASTVRRALDAGATVVTHMFNGMQPIHHREVSLPGVALTDPRLWVELIADGEHVGDDAVDLVVQSAAQRLLLVSDAMAATGLGNGEYVLAGSLVRVQGGVARLVEGDSLAGSTSLIRDAVQRLLGRGIGYADIVRWTSTNPAAVLGIEVPKLQPGDRADLVGLSGGRLTRVLRGGVQLEPTSDSFDKEGIHP